MSLSLIVGHAQRRVKRQRIGITVAGQEWNGEYWADTWIDPLTETLMLRPPALYADWWTTNAGNYAKPALAGYSVSNAAHWREYDRFGNGFTDYLLSTQDVAGAWAAVAIAKNNRPVTFAIGAVSAGDDRIVAQIGYGAAGTPDLNAGIRFDLYAHGTVVCHLDGEYIGHSSMGSFANRTRTLMVIPCRKREILILSTEVAFAGEGVTDAARFVLESIDESAADPEIVPAGQFYCYLPVAAETAVQIVPMKFAATGYATSLVATLAEPPPTGATLEQFSNESFPTATPGDPVDWSLFGHNAFADTPDVTDAFVEVVKTDNTAYVPDGIIDQVRLKCTLEGDSDYTPFIYGSHVAFEAEFADTDDSAETELIDEVLQAEGVDIDVPDDPGGVALSFALAAPEAIEASIPKLRTITARQVKALFGTNAEILDGLSEPMEFEYPDFAESEGYGRWTWRNAAARLERYIFREPVPLDGMYLSKPCNGIGEEGNQSAIRFILERAGFPIERTRLTDLSYRLDRVPGARSGDWNQMISVGEDAWTVLRRLCDSHAQGFLWQFRPWTDGEIFEFTDPSADFTDTPHATVYETYEDAIAEEGEDPNDPEAIDNISHLLIENFRERPLPIEGNEVRVTGLDSRTGEAIQAYKIDAASQDPEADPNALSDNWLGFAKPIGISLRRLNTQASIERACSAVFDQVTLARFGASWDGFMLTREGEDPGDLVPLWRGDLVEIFGRGKYRIVSMRISIGDEPFDGTAAGQKRVWRKCSFVGIRTAEHQVAPRGYGGISLDETIQNMKAMAAFGRLQEATFRPPTNPRKVYAAP